jgi:obg-like ATPase 1
MGIVGLPNVGKSSLFNLLTSQSAPAENFPFCTIDPNEARCPVPDERYDLYYQLIQPLQHLAASFNSTRLSHGNRHCGTHQGRS